MRVLLNLSFHISDSEGKFLVTLARKAVTQKIKEGRIIQPPANTPKQLFEYAGVFVTINTLCNNKKKLRGCIGYPYPTHGLVEALIDSAINAALHDPRFLPINVNELNNLIFEVSVLTPPQLVKVVTPMDYPSKVRIGQDGLIIERGYDKGLLLPQVPVEWDWNSEDFLSHCCLKAGLSPDSWLLKGGKK